MKRSGFRKLAKWVGLAGCALLFFGWIGTFWSAFGYRTATTSVNLWGGCLETSLIPTGMPTVGWFAQLSGYEVYWFPKFIHGRSAGVRTTHVFVPLWIPFLILAIPTAFLWHPDRRPPPNHCQSCGYNLTGNVSGVCPECGEQV